MAELHVHPAAVEEMNAAFDWYLQRSPAAASSLLNQIDSAMASIDAAPGTWPKHKYGTQRFLLRVFPFQIVYRFNENRIQVLAFAHDKRKPGYWKARGFSI